MEESMKPKLINFRASKQLHEALQELRLEYGVSFSEAIRLGVWQVYKNRRKLFTYENYLYQREL